MASGEQIGKGMDQIQVSKKMRKHQKKQQAKQNRKRLKADEEITRLPKRYNGWAS